MIVESTRRGIGVLWKRTSESKPRTSSDIAAKTHPVLRIQIQVLHVPMLEETGQAHTVVSKV